MSARITVVGVGNVHRRDDGVGPAVIARLARHAEEGTLPASVGLQVSDGEPARLLALWERADSVIVVDAVRTSRPVPGRVHRLEADDVVPQCEAGASSPSSHGLGLGAALRLARALGRLPRHLVVYGVEAADTGLGTGLTTRTAEAVGPLADRIMREIRGHRLRASPVPDGESVSNSLRVSADTARTASSSAGIDVLPGSAPMRFRERAAREGRVRPLTRSVDTTGSGPGPLLTWKRTTRASRTEGDSTQQAAPGGWDDA
ncbi:hydrogenase maturation protease [Streptomyces sp. DW4-2]|uniref:Hydrogenase maturation protease n=1 Tax=Streptomyces spirodelae TaxID=2812904 RepID=A0ABS3WXE1_9ACTN|nr:hydrogenase maturation protease [Streptomyces spirodelae]